MTDLVDDLSDLPPHVAAYLRQQGKSAHADRGKECEGKVKTYLTNLNKQILPFMFEKLPDARSAKGALRAVICDFHVLCRSVSFYLETKETRHPYRLAKDKVPQIAKLRKAELAGGVPFVLVWHSVLDKWRAMPISYFDGDLPASWDLRNMPLHDTLQAALNSIPQWKTAVVIE